MIKLIYSAKRMYLKNPFKVWLIIIILFAFFFRFWNYLNRWALAYDQAQFATVAGYALETLQLPLLGPFSSGGPFQTGGEWYWIVMLGIATFPNFILSPWIFNSLLTILAVIVMIYIGNIYKNKLFGIILGLLIAFSPAQIHQSTNLTSQTTMVLFSSLSMLFVFIFLRKKRNLFFLLACLSVGIATSIHIQAVALIPFLILTIILFRKNIVRKILYLGIGLFVPWIPVLISDSQNNFYNTIQILTYFTNEQASTSYDVLGRRWLTFLSEFIPDAWRQIVGGNIIIGYSLIILSGLLFVYKAISRKLSKEVVLIFLSLSAMIVIMRYIRTPLFESFYIFIHPFVLFISGWLIYFIFKINKIFGTLFLILVLVVSFLSFWKPINEATNNTFTYVQELKTVLYKMYPGDTFSIYDYEGNNTTISMSLSLILFKDKRIDTEGRKIGMYRFTPNSSFNFDINPIYGEYGGILLYDLSASESSRLVDLGWENYDPNTVYNRTEFWFREDVK